jgi:aryl-alcohol dehydrogenase-like predicted oxidoreductase
VDEAALEYVKLSRANGLDPAQVAIRFTLDQKFLTSCIVGATNLEQLRADIEAADLDLPPEVLQGIAKIHAQRPNPVQ